MPSNSFIKYFLDWLSVARDIDVKSDFSRDDIGALFNAERSRVPFHIDDQTWDDLDMDSYVDMVSDRVSIHGRQMLYYNLRGGKVDEIDPPARWIDTINGAKGNAEFDAICLPLLRSEVEIGSLFSSDVLTIHPWWSNFIWLFQLLVILSILGIWFSPYSVIVTIALIVTSGALQISHHSEITNWVGKAKSLQHVINVAPHAIDLANKYRMRVPAGFNKVDWSEVQSRLSCTSVAATLPGIGEYLDWFLADNIKMYYRSRKAFEDLVVDLRKSFYFVSLIESAFAMAKNLRLSKHYCQANAGEVWQLQFERMVHPLLSSAIPVSFAVDNVSVFLSGKNGSGKSTLLRSIGVNLIVGRSFGFCYAESCQIPFSPVYSSIRNEDSLNGGQSLYTSELLRAKELIKVSHDCAGATILIDEIFRGTNHVESVAVAASVLYELSKNSIVFVSSHNVILAPILSKWFLPLCLDRVGADTVKLSEGILVETNGISLLSKYDIDIVVRNRATHIADWLTTFLSKPTNFPLDEFSE